MDQHYLHQMGMNANMAAQAAGAVTSGQISSLANLLMGQQIQGDQRREIEEMRLARSRGAGRAGQSLRPNRSQGEQQPQRQPRRGMVTEFRGDDGAVLDNPRSRVVGPGLNPNGVSVIGPESSEREIATGMLMGGQPKEGAALLDSILRNETAGEELTQRREIADRESNAGILRTLMPSDGTHPTYSDPSAGNARNSLLQDLGVSSGGVDSQVDPRQQQRMSILENSVGQAGQEAFTVADPSDPIKQQSASNQAEAKRLSELLWNDKITPKEALDIARKSDSGSAQGTVSTEESFKKFFEERIQAKRRNDALYEQIGNNPYDMGAAGSM